MRAQLSLASLRGITGFVKGLRPRHCLPAPFSRTLGLGNSSEPPSSQGLLLPVGIEEERGVLRSSILRMSRLVGLSLLASRDPAKFIAFRIEFYVLPPGCACSRVLDANVCAGGAVAPGAFFHFWRVCVLFCFGACARLMRLR